MDDRTARLESTVAELRQTVVSLEQRLEALEAGIARRRAAAPAATDAAGPASGAVEEKSPYDPITLLTLVGRLLLVLAGGYFLRAMTEMGTLAVPVGLSLAFAYALVWLFMSYRAGRGRPVLNGVFHAMAAAMVAFPLIVEATIRFKVLHGAVPVAVIAGLSAALLFVAWQRRLQTVAWITVLASLPTGFILLAQTGVVAPVALYLIALGLGTLWLGYALEWSWPRWPVALAADVAVVGVTLRAVAPEHQDAPQLAMLLQALLLAGYLVSIALRTIVRGRNVSIFEILQTAAALAVGFGGAVYLTWETGTLPVVFGVAGVVFGAACYGVAVAFVDGRQGLGRNVYFYTTLALAMIVTGLMLTFPAPWPAIVSALLAVAAALLWVRFGRLFMLIHCIAYLLAAGVASGALVYAADALAANAAGPWSPPGAAALVLTLAAGASAWIVTAGGGAERVVVTRALAFALFVVFVWFAGGWLVGTLAPVAGGLADGSVDAGVLATVRTVVLALATLLIAWLGRNGRYRDWGWLVYPLLVGIGLKMVMQDFKYSRPSTLFIAMALYGAALIIAPRLWRAAGRRGAVDDTPASRRAAAAPASAPHDRLPVEPADAVPQ